MIETQSTIEICLTLSITPNLSFKYRHFLFCPLLTTVTQQPAWQFLMMSLHSFDDTALAL